MKLIHKVAGILVGMGIGLACMSGVATAAPSSTIPPVTGCTSAIGQPLDPQIVQLLGACRGLTYLHPGGPSFGDRVIATVTRCAVEYLAGAEYEAGKLVIGAAGARGLGVTVLTCGADVRQLINAYNASHR